MAWDGRPVPRWSTYAPVWAAGTTPNIGNGTLVGRYTIAADKTVHFSIELVGGSTTTWGTGAYSLTLPVTPALNRALTFDVGIRDASAGAYMSGKATWLSPRIYLVVPPSSAGSWDRSVTNVIPTTFAVNDQIIVTGSYEAA